MSSKKSNDNPFSALANFVSKHQDQAEASTTTPDYKKASSRRCRQAAEDLEQEAALFLQNMANTGYVHGSRHHAKDGTSTDFGIVFQNLKQPPAEKNAKQRSGRPESTKYVPSGEAAPSNKSESAKENLSPIDLPDDEQNAFLSAVKNVEPLSGKGRVPHDFPPPPDPPHNEPNSLKDLVEGRVEFSITGTDEFVSGHVLGLDPLIIGKLQQGAYSPEAHIDLHGLNSEQAFENLKGFFRRSYYKGVRTVLIVTGRGLNSPNKMPILRNKVQAWMMQEPFRRIILAFCTAKRKDGGPGALYVLLRKSRKNSGKVRWDVLPADPDLFP